MEDDDGDELKRWQKKSHLPPACILAVVSSKRHSRHISSLENPTISEVLFMK